MADFDVSGYHVGMPDLLDPTSTAAISLLLLGIGAAYLLAAVEPST
jgi:hypothetical protein